VALQLEIAVDLTHCTALPKYCSVSFKVIVMNYEKKVPELKYA
jgi:hypothetical protein